MSVAEELRQQLEQVFTPAQLEVIDESESHRGHAGWREGGETHFRIVIRDPRFAGMSRIARHRAVHEALGRDLLSRIHALALDIDG